MLEREDLTRRALTLAEDFVANSGGMACTDRAATRLDAQTVNHGRGVVRPLTRSGLGQSTAKPTRLLPAEVRLLHGGRMQDDLAGGIEAARAVVAVIVIPFPWSRAASVRNRRSECVWWRVGAYAGFCAGDS